MNNCFIYILFLVINCVISAVSQVLLKKAALKNYKGFIWQYLNVNVITAYLLFFAVVVFNTYILKFLPLTIVNPLSESLPYILSIVSGFMFFGEKFSVRMFIGAFVILCGIIMIVI